MTRCHSESLHDSLSWVVQPSAGGAALTGRLMEDTSSLDVSSDYRKLTLDPNTVNHELRLCEKNREVRWRGIVQRHPDHPERFDFKPQVLCKEGVCGRCYWEAEWHTEEDESVSVSVSYKAISRKGWGNESSFGRNDQSWNLECGPTRYFWHYNCGMALPAPPSLLCG
ncbi:hypothetical protein NFI96_008007 [Prochilodus magdalenae]|nr:hypothetical protein NFI96_008007 [Prochilodus magdalenae]